MDVFYKLLLLSILSSSAFAQAQKDPDEDSPYEFGFTIDGQQHRHEKKDDRGIIQGEFGFITADGIYHVTVYATDENGSFKILSMRNLRISAPLDGSPFKGEISPEANKYRKQANLPPIPPPQPSPNPLALPEEEVPQQKITPKPSEFVKFTTQPTVKPGCASCGYITTRKPEPGQSAFPIQRTGLGAQNQNVVGNTFGNIPEKSITSADSRDTSNSQETPNNVPNTQLAAKEIIQSSGVPQKSPLPYQIAAGPQNTKYNTFGDDTNVPQVQPYQNTAGQRVPNTSGSPTGTADVGGLARSDVEGGSNLNDNANPLSIGTPDSNNVGSLHGNYNQPNSRVPVSITETGSNNNVPFSQVEVGGVNQISTEGEAGQITSNAPSGNELPLPMSVSPQISSKSITQHSENPEPNPLQIPGQTPNAVSTLPPISVSNGAIHVGGDRKQVIPIKDKFPGMEDGLPAGIDEKDITDLLYKFHYTVGFHGHYEKGLKNGAKIGGYFVNGRDGISRVVTYIADENGYRPKVRFVNLGLESEDTPKPETEKTFGLKDFEFVWYPI